MADNDDNHNLKPMVSMITKKIRFFCETHRKYYQLYTKKNSGENPSEIHFRFTNGSIYKFIFLTL